MLVMTGLTRGRARGAAVRSVDSAGASGTASARIMAPGEAAFYHPRRSVSPGWAQDAKRFAGRVWLKINLANPWHINRLASKSEKKSRSVKKRDTWT